MALSDYTHGSDTQPERSYRLLAVPMAQGGRRGNTPIKTFLHFRHAASPDGRWLFASPLANLPGVSKVKVVSVLMGLTLVFVVVASYALAWDSKGLLFTPQPPDHLRPALIPASAAATAADVALAAPAKSFRDMKQLVKLIDSKLQYPRRRIPSRTEVTGTDSRVSPRTNEAALTCFERSEAATCANFGGLVMTPSLSGSAVRAGICQHVEGK